MHNATVKQPFIFVNKYLTGARLAQWLASRTTDQVVPGLRPDRVAICCCLEQVIFTPCLVLVKPRKPWTYDILEQTVRKLETTLRVMF